MPNLKKIYFLVYNVTPINANEYFEVVEGALAHCWIKTYTAESALEIAKFNISKNDWDIVKIDASPIEVLKKHFIGQEGGAEQFEKAQKSGIAIVYASWARDKKSSFGPLPVKSSYKFPIGEFISNQNQLSKKGRCYHFESGVQCNEIIKAHSIQKNRSLATIVENGHVYRASLRTYKNQNGRINFEKMGINKTTTFMGFCGKHDYELFEPIDNYNLLPTDQQVFLYAYRSICRELFVKENSLELITNQLKNDIPVSAIKNHLLDF